MPRRVPTYKPRIPGFSRHSEYDTARRDPEAKGFYNSSAWVKLRLMKLRRDPLCELCKSQGKLIAATVVHHKAELRADPELALELDNLQSLCASCHSQLHASREAGG